MPQSGKNTFHSIQITSITAASQSNSDKTRQRREQCDSNPPWDTLLLGVRYVPHWRAATFKVIHMAPSKDAKGSSQKCVLWHHQDLVNTDKYRQLDLRRQDFDRMYGFWRETLVDSTCRFAEHRSVEDPFRMDFKFCNPATTCNCQRKRYSTAIGWRRFHVWVSRLTVHTGATALFR